MLLQSRVGIGDGDMTKRITASRRNPVAPVRLDGSPSGEGFRTKSGDYSGD